MTKTLTGLTAVAAALLLAGCAGTPPKVAPIVDQSDYSQGTRQAAPVSGSITPLTPGTVRDSGRTHVVAPGDTLYNISVRYGLDSRALASLNAVTDPTQLRLGQVLRLPESVTEPRVPVVSQNVRVSRVPGVEPETVTTPSQEPETVVLDPATKTGGTPAITNTPNQDIAEAAQPAKTAPKTTPAVAPGTRMLWPVQGTVLSDYSANGKGLDIAGTQGDVVVAAAAGQVLFVGDGVKGYGQLVIIKHSPTLVTAYGHNDKIVVKLNDKVRAGQKIAELGSSESSRPMLRFEVREKGKPVDPMRYLGPKR